MHRLVSIILLLPTALYCQRYVLATSEDIIKYSSEKAKSQIGIKESGSNRGEVWKYQSAAGIQLGSPYCMAFQYWCFLPYKILPRTGLANYTFDYAKKYGVKSVGYEADDLIIWRKPNSINGHIGRITAILKSGWVETIEANTSSGSGNQRDGDGIYKRKRNIKHPLGRMYVRGFVGFRL